MSAPLSLMSGGVPVLVVSVGFVVHVRVSYRFRDIWLVDRAHIGFLGEIRTKVFLWPPFSLATIA